MVLTLSKRMDQLVDIHSNPAAWDCAPGFGLGGRVWLRWVWYLLPYLWVSVWSCLTVHWPVSCFLKTLAMFSLVSLYTTQTPLWTHWFMEEHYWLFQPFPKEVWKTNSLTQNIPSRAPEHLSGPHKGRQPVDWADGAVVSAHCYPISLLPPSGRQLHFCPTCNEFSEVKVPFPLFLYTAASRRTPERNSLGLHLINNTNSIFYLQLLTCSNGTRSFQFVHDIHWEREEMFNLF